MTYSIVARDPQTGELGVAVQSHYFGVGRVVSWAEAGVGAVATQSVVDASYGPRGIDLMRDGVPADQALQQLLLADGQAQVRQVSMIDAGGALGAHTGSGCIGRAGDCQGLEVSAQANLMERATVWQAMIDAYQGAAGQALAERLLIALEAAQAEGGDLRGMQSASMRVVSGQRSAAPWDQVKVDLRVDDASEPLVELRRLYRASLASDELASVLGSGILFTDDLQRDAPGFLHAIGHLNRAQAGLGDNREPTFWLAVLLAKAGLLEEARTQLSFALETNTRWNQLLHSIADAGVLPDDCPLLGED